MKSWTKFSHEIYSLKIKKCYYLLPDSPFDFTLYQGHAQRVVADC